jgi:ankyrin repeat protein
MPPFINVVSLAGIALIATTSFQNAPAGRRGLPWRETDPWTLQYAAAHGQLKLAEMLLKLGFDVNEKGSNGNRALDIACLKGNAAFVKILVDNGADVTLRNSAGTTPLHDAALSGTPAVGEILLAHGAEIDATDPETGATPLYNSVSFGKAEFAKLLIAKGAKNVKLKSGKSILDTAKANGLTDIVTLLQNRHQ